MNSPIKNWRQTKQLPQYLGKTGKLITWTKVFVAPSGFEHEAPYIAGIVEFNRLADSEGVIRMAVQIVDCEEKNIKEGMAVKTVIRRIGKQDSNEVINYGIKVAPM